MVQRVTYRRRLSYNTKSNRRKIVRTPGGKLVFQYLKKRPNVPKCPMTGIRLKGVKPMRPSEKSRVSLRQKKVYRAYGGKSKYASNYIFVTFDRKLIATVRIAFVTSKPPLNVNLSSQRLKIYFYSKYVLSLTRVCILLFLLLTKLVKKTMQYTIKIWGHKIWPTSADVLI